MWMKSLGLNETKDTYCILWVRRVGNILNHCRTVCPLVLWSRPQHYHVGGDSVLLYSSRQTTCIFDGVRTDNAVSR